MISAAERLSQLASTLDSSGMLPSAQITGALAPGSSHAHVWNETPTGQLDGIATTVTLAGSPSPPASLLLFRNGLLLRAGNGNDYTLAGAVITFLPNNLPQPGDDLVASYTT